MCANYETISKDRVHLLDLFEFIFRHTWKNSQFALIPVDTIYEQKYIEGKVHWYGVYRKDRMPFTVAALYEDVLSQIK